MIKVSPSLLAADFANLGREIESVYTADYLHIDIMDGLFVPNISVGFPVVSAIKRSSNQPLDVHLMIQEPIRYIDKFIKYGANLLTIHAEADTPENTSAALQRIRELGCRASLCLKPATPADSVLPYLSLCDMILVMTVEPGFGGQSFMESQLPKIAEISRMIREGGYCCDVEVDGGIDVRTAPLVKEAGANVLVAGSFIFRSEDRTAAIKLLR